MSSKRNEKSYKQTITTVNKVISIQADREAAERKKAEDEIKRKAEEEARKAEEEARKAEEERLAEEARIADGARKAEEEKLAEEARKVTNHIFELKTAIFRSVIFYFAIIINLLYVPILLKGTGLFVFHKLSSQQNSFEFRSVKNE